MIWTRLLKQDLQFQWRHGFYAAYVFVSLIYILLLRQLPAGWQERAAATFLFSDPAGLGFFFVGGIFLLERSEGLHGALFTAPVTVRAYLTAKALSLSLLSILAGLAIAYFGVRQVVHWPALLFGLGSGSVFFTLLGIGTAVRCHSVNQYLLVAISFSPLYAPILQTWDVLPDHFLWYLSPGRGILALLESAVLGRIVSPWAILSILGWLIVVVYWCEQRFRQHVLSEMGWEA